jgi:hypothetical protein
MFRRLPVEVSSGVGGISLRTQLSLSRPVVDGHCSEWCREAYILGGRLVYGPFHSSSHNMSDLKNDDKAVGNSQLHLEHATSQPKEDKTGAGTLDQVLANGFGTHISNEDRAAALKMAHAADPGPDVYSWRYMKFVMLAIVACVCSGDNGTSFIYGALMTVDLQDSMARS